jgi:serine/threonine protein kinase
MRPGLVIGERFEIGTLAARGGMGQVYRARDTLTGAQVAIKVVLAEDSRAVERFVREAAVLAELRHPGSSSTSATAAPTTATCTSRWSGWRARTSARGWRAAP